MHEIEAAVGEGVSWGYDLPTIIVANNNKNKNNHNKQKQTPVKSGFLPWNSEIWERVLLINQQKFFISLFLKKKTNVTAKCFSLDKNTNGEFIELY